MKRPTKRIIGWVIAAVGGWGVAIVILLFLLLLVTLGVVISSRDNALPFSSTASVEPIPPQLVPLYHAAGAKYHVPWAILAGINKVETDFGRDLSVSSAGAIGFMQFEPSTWAQYGVDADGDGKIDPYDPVDAIFSAAHYLSVSGVKKNPMQAVFQYNHSTDYVREVLRLAEIYQTWNPLSSAWVWPVADTGDRISGVGHSNSEPLNVIIHCPAGVTVQAVHNGTVTSVTGMSVTLDLGNGLTVIEQGLRPTVSSAQVVHVGEPLGMAATRGVTASIEEQGAPLPLLWFVSPSQPNLAPTPPPMMTPTPANTP
ncbi:lytic transglycosylase domain-containing protein [Ferroacidibacillus organovorans]|uniref:Transglycosylase SLT domain-containing protein n=1 Tax=Ferroacidibacillus organovorans TaxID=1765683 RepID=A0A101XQS5_9BACL|nr:lytic transglycosylase domain-containing protein [Ferroacidibacillus organovorans]KUO95801.1 hypothetical protein ATW55_15005 [Ferroacidibacillus organovorans]